MKKFMVLYMAPAAEFGKLMANSKPEDMKKSMDGWRAWMEEHKESFVDSGAPLGKTKRITAQGVEDVKNDMGGYSIIQAESHDAATKLFQSQPHFGIPGAWIEVMEIMQMPGM
jgi:hypothetical protein